MSEDPDSPYKIRKPAKEEFRSISHLINENFNPEETMLQCLLSYNRASITEEETQQIEADLQNLILTILANYPSQVVVDSRTNEIVGVNIMVAIDNPKADIAERSVDIYEICVPKSRILVDYFNYMNGLIEKAKLFDKFPGVKRTLEFYVVAVDKNHRRKNLANRLLKDGVEFARRLGVDLVYGLFTSEYSKKAAIKAGFVNVKDFDLLEICDAEGKRVFERSSPHHNIASVMALSIV